MTPRQCSLQDEQISLTAQSRATNISNLQFEPYTATATTVCLFIYKFVRFMFHYSLIIIFIYFVLTQYV